MVKSLVIEFKGEKTTIAELSSVRRKGERRKIDQHLNSRTGYLTVQLFFNGVVLRRTVHRLVMEVFVGPLRDGFETRHLDGNRLNNSISNLRYGTRSENAEDRRRHGTLQIGDSSSSAKLTSDDVIEIRRLYATGSVLQRELAEKYGVTQSTIRRAIVRQCWSHI
jgi:hypothetical protein